MNELSPHLPLSLSLRLISLMTSYQFKLRHKMNLRTLQVQ